jgi:hypothetical protein
MYTYVRHMLLESLIMNKRKREEEEATINTECIVYIL